MHHISVVSVFNASGDDSLEVLSNHMRIDLRGLDILMAKGHLNGAQIAGFFEYMRREGMA